MCVSKQFTPFVHMYVKIYTLFTCVCKKFMPFLHVYVKNYTVFTCVYKKFTPFLHVYVNSYYLAFSPPTLPQGGDLLKYEKNTVH